MINTFSQVTSKFRIILQIKHSMAELGQCCSNFWASVCCNFLCCECNCLIFPRPNPSYKPDFGYEQKGIRVAMSILNVQNRSIPYIELSTEKSRLSKNCIIYFHGNAQDIGMACTFLEPIIFQVQTTIFAIEYPTYGIYEKFFPAMISNQIKEDSVLFYDYLREAKLYSHENIIVMGRSIGSGGATYLAATKKTPILILISPFDSITSVAGDFVQCGGCCVKQHFNNEQEIKDFNGRLLLIHGERDDVIIVNHGKHLANVFSAKHIEKITAIYPNEMTHNRFDMNKDIVQPIFNFLKSHEWEK